MAFRMAWHVNCVVSRSVFSVHVVKSGTSQVLDGLIQISLDGSVAQLVSASVLHTEGHGFEPHRSQFLPILILADFPNRKVSQLQDC